MLASFTPIRKKRIFPAKRPTFLKNEQKVLKKPFCTLFSYFTIAKREVATSSK